MHGTSSNQVEAILAEGLKAHTCLTCSEALAQYYAECAAEEDGGVPVWLLAEVDPRTLRVDYAAFQEPLTYYRDEHAGDDDDWHAMIDAGEIPYPSSDKDWQTALAVTWSVKTNEPVKPRHIHLGLGDEVIASRLSSHHVKCDDVYLALSSKPSALSASKAASSEASIRLHSGRPARCKGAVKNIFPSQLPIIRSIFA